MDRPRAPKKKKEIKGLATSAWGRSLSLAKLGLQAGAKAAGHAVGNVFGAAAEEKLRRQAYMVQQLGLLATELGKLKGSLMKAGQMLSVYGEHFLPPEANAVLKSLQSDSPPLEWKEIRKALVRQLGKERLALLEVDEVAYAAASLGQVHRARVIATGQEIVLKVQYPGVDDAVDGDLKALRKILALSEWLPKLPATDDIFAEIRAMLKRELDYTLELASLEKFRAALRDDPRYVLPVPLPEFCTKRVLAMSFEPGEAVDSLAVSTISQARRNLLAEAALDIYLRELFEWQSMQTDPHFGNYRVRLGENGEPDRLVFYDFGAVREISPDFLLRYRRMLAGIFYRDRAEFERGAAALGVLRETDPPELKDLFHQLCSAIVEPFAREEPYDWKTNDLPARVTQLTWEIIRKFPLRSPPREVVFLDRKMIGMFTFLAVLGAKINARKALAPFMEKEI